MLERNPLPALWVCSHRLSGLFTRWRGDRLLEGDGVGRCGIDVQLQITFGVVEVADDRVAVDADRNRRLPAVAPERVDVGNVDRRGDLGHDAPPSICSNPAINGAQSSTDGCDCSICRATAATR